MNWCDRNSDVYVIGLARNNVLLRQAADLTDEAAEWFAASNTSTRLFAG